MELRDVQNVERRVRAYWYLDGWAELAGGGVFILLGLFFAGQEWLPKGSLLEALFAPGLLLVFVAATIATSRVVNAMKARFTYPRTGYVSYRVDQKHVGQRRLAAGLSAAVFAMVLVFVAARTGTTGWVPAVSGIIVAGTLLYMESKGGGLRRFYLLAVLSAVLGIALSFGPVPLGYRLAMFYGFMGLAFMVSGGLGLRRYLLENPLPPEATREH